jgi:hypothetical protein
MREEVVSRIPLGSSCRIFTCEERAALFFLGCK